MDLNHTGTATWLELLADGGGPEEIDAVLQLLLSASADGSAKGSLLEEARLATRISTELQDSRQQQAELAALYDIGVRLSAVRELDELLQEVVAQARRLLAVDVAYLALVGDDSSLTIEVTEGSLGPRLRGARLAPGAGLAGLVVQSGEPVTSLDYLADPALTHQAGLDQVAEAEGLRTISGVPLRLHGRVIGVLMTADREVRPLLPRQMSMLSSFASMVAVALDNARLFDELRRTGDQLAAANQELRRSSDIVTRASTLHARLMDAALRGGGASELVTSLSAIVGGEAQFAGVDDVVVAAARKGSPVPGVTTVQLLDGTSPSQRFRSSSGPEPIVTANVVIVAVAAADEYFGTLKVTLPTDADDTVIRLLERTALSLALLESTQRSIAAAAGRDASEVLERLFELGRGDDPAFPRRAYAAGLHLESPHMVLVVDPTPSGERRVTEWTETLVKECGGLVGKFGGLTVALLRTDPDEALSVDRPHFDFGVAALAGPAQGRLGLTTAWQEARSCLRAMQALGRSNVIADPSQLGPYYFLLGQSGRTSARSFVDAVLGELVRVDRRGELCRTAEAYLKNSGRHAPTAAALGIHANTLYQRLDRITAVLGSSWKEGDRALDVQLGFKVKELLEQE